MTNNTIEYKPITEIGWEEKYYPRKLYVRGKEKVPYDHVASQRMYEVLTSNPDYQLLAKDVPLAVRAPHGKKYKWLLIDGVQRLICYHRAGRTTFPMVIQRKLPESRYLALAARLNCQHGTRLTPQEIAIVAGKLRDHGMATEEIATVFDFPPERITTWLADREVIEIKTVGGQPIVHTKGMLKTAMITAKGKRARTRALNLQAPIATQSIENIIREMKALLASGVLIGWDEDLRDLRRMIDENLNGECASLAG